MNFALDAEQEQLRATARAFLAQCSSSPQVRAAMDSELGWDPAVWRRIAVVGQPPPRGGGLFLFCSHAMKGDKTTEGGEAMIMRGLDRDGVLVLAAGWLVALLVTVF